ncbi:hypothetical protein ABNB59_21495 [Paenibacillus larvae]|uniref:Uncharacterized protein n=2 Tax=Paenibacillus larvae TaxID=1464 RepID=A0A6C0QXJ7_9BACL|nr:hypothetical protein [Paenibacillus larvae]AQR76258.1 hypothetical protein BXP28_01405 [Paenibacillus larvae subsp. larvae]AVF22957.1 hypothetical protein ERICI_03173 [Paenibacillus larvae subsp. larvae]ETK26384.1 hypothetical protein ERIC1_2c05830 [Paenibacillus larvae subsp. larvae DSM 25719]MCY7478724.1 hypothetical protein [Paenibacillus larvae]MCY7492095.1 hypothetical protein [Paenibacillus larvae]
MKILSKALLSSIAAFGLLAGSVSTQTPGQQAITSQQAGVKSTIVNPLIKLKVGWSTWIGMPGSKVVLVSGEGVVSLDQYGKVVGLSPGNATVYNYAADGNLYINHIQVTY